MLVFSSAEMTNSSLFRDLPFQERSYRSRIRLALTAKAGSRAQYEEPRYLHRVARLLEPTHQRHGFVA